MAINPDLSTIPTQPGVYIFKDQAGRAIYVGKAARLRDRVRSYFGASAGFKEDQIVVEAGDLEFIVTGSEVEALILEQSLIKRHRPRFNIRFKDDKHYPYIRVAWQDDFPKVHMVRQMRRDGAKYYGPFASSQAMYRTLDIARRIFPYLTCDRKITGKDKQPCLYYHLHLCTAPCIGVIHNEDYRKLIAGLCEFLEGKHEVVVESLRKQMEEAAERLDYERAARLRDQVRAITRTMEKQRIVSKYPTDQDVIALVKKEGEAGVQVFFVRQGRLIGRESFILEGIAEEEESEILGSFVKQFYDGVAYIPAEVLLSHEIAEAELIAQWLIQRRESNVNVSVPRRGQRKELVELAQENAAQMLEHLERQTLAEEGKAVAALADLQERLGLEEMPSRIEGYDISNIQGKFPTGSMVVFKEGRPEKKSYRHFSIRTVPGPDDYAMMKEVLSRRFRRALDKGARDWAELPDLILIDGGKGQLSAAREVLDEQGLDYIPSVALAKEREEIFKPGQSVPIILPEGSGALHLVQRIRDESHRFAKSLYERQHRKEGLVSLLDEIPGVGPRRKKALLQHFGSWEAIAKASLQELSEIQGMNEIVAQRVKESLEPHLASPRRESVGQN